MLDSYTPYNFHKTRQILGAGGLAVLAKKYCIHLIYICLSHVMQLSKKNRSYRAYGLAAFEKNIRFTSFTFDSHPLCNFCKKQVIGEGGLDALA